MKLNNYHSVDGELISETADGVRTDYLADALGSVEATGDASATLRNRYARKPYGAPLAKAGADADPVCGFVGELGYRETKRRFASHYALARHYDDATAAWTSVAPLWPGESAYGYVRGNPNTWVDPSGEESIGININLFIHVSENRAARRLRDCSGSVTGGWIQAPLNPSGLAAFRGDSRDFFQAGPSRQAPQDSHRRSL